MFSYVRYFSLFSALLVVVAAVLVGMYFKSVASGDVSELVKKNNVALAQGFINTTWKQHYKAIKLLMDSDISVDQWQNYQEFIVFSKDTFRYFDEMPVTKFNIYTPRGELILSRDQIKIMFFDKNASPLAGSGDNSKNQAKEAFQEAMAGKVSNRIIEDSGFRSADGTLTRGTLVQTFIPIISDQYVPVVADNTAPQVDGIIEVFYNVSQQWTRLGQFQVIGTGGIIIIFVVLITILIITSRKAEMIIARQHETNLELAAQAASAEAENREKSQFLANVSHELRTPLNAIIGFSEIIKTEMMGLVENTQYQDYIRDIHSSGVHLLSLINDILDFSKAEAGKLEIDLGEVDATKVIINCMRLVSPRAETAQVKLVEDLPKEHYVLRTDAKKLKQVLLNLLSNAVKFTPAGGEVRVSAWQNVIEDSISIQVKDTGIGIAPKDISRAMAPFGQVDSALSRKYEGTGLGLPLTKKFVEIMGGTFNIQSEINQGTTIKFTLPVDPNKLAKPII